MNQDTHVAASTVAAHAESVVRQYLTFQLNGRSYGVPMREVAEITPNLPLNRIPHLPKGVDGLLDLRGALLPVLNTRAKLGLPVEGAPEPANILILGEGENRVGLLVDEVESVRDVREADHAMPSPLLEGLTGAWATAFLLVDRKIVTLLDPRMVLAIGTTKAEQVLAADASTLEKAMDEDLERLVETAPPKSSLHPTHVIPHMQTTIEHTEHEMLKVLDRVEAMLIHTDRSFQGMARLKHAAQLGHLAGQEAKIAEAERVGQEIQDHVFSLIQMIQYQDIVRQKLERVLRHISGLQSTVSSRFRDAGKSVA